MSDWTVHLEFEEGNSSKFWRARVDGKTLYVNYGKIGSNGQTQIKDFADTGTAMKEFDKLVREERAPAPRPSAPAQRPAGGTRMLLEAGARKVEAHLVLDGKTVRMESMESY